MTTRQHLLLSLVLVSGGCGFGTAGLLSATQGGGGSAAPSNAPTTLTGLQVLTSKVSPATIRLELSDNEGDPVHVEFLYVLPSAPEVRVPLTTLAANPAPLSTSRQGIAHSLAWDFASEPGIATTARIATVTLIARMQDGSERSTATDLGNDPPVIQINQVPSSASGVVPLGYTVTDSSGDTTRVRVEYSQTPGNSSSWLPARPAGLPSTEPTPAYAIDNLVALPAPGTSGTFFWDSGRDLAGVDGDLTVRFTPSDASPLVGQEATAILRIDNSGNQRPVALVNDGALLAAGDRRRAVAVPLTVYDEESDRVDVVLQWRRVIDAQFPSLGTSDPAQLRQLLDDESFLREKQICRSGALWGHGNGQLLDSRHLRTPDLATGQAWLLPMGIVGRQVELLRAPNAPPHVVSAAWTTNPLTSPVAALAAPGGRQAIVLDDLPGQPQVLRIDISSGAVVQQVGLGIAGTPTAMAPGYRRQQVLVAVQVGSGWSLLSVDLSARTTTTLAAATTGGPLRGLLSWREKAALVTTGNRLLSIDWTDISNPRLTTLLGNLAEPWGVVADPHDSQRVFLAERSYAASGLVGRVAAWDLNTRLPVGILPLASMPVRPTALSIAGPNSLLVLEESTPGQKALRCHRLGADRAAGTFPSITLGAGANSVAAFATSDPLGWLVCDPAARTITTRGGITGAATITAYDPATTTMTLASDLVGTGAVAWRLRVASARDLPSSPAGTTSWFVWDTRAVAGIGPVCLRTMAIDGNLGQFSQATSGIAYAADDHTPQTMPNAGVALGTVADLDADGDLDVTATGLVYQQTSPRTFAVAPNTISGTMVVFDANGDGRNDLASLAGQVRIHHQDASGLFHGPDRTIALGASHLLDLDGDGLFDLVDASNKNSITVHMQQASGAFVSTGPITNTELVSDVKFADMSNDGRLDMLLVRRGNGSNYTWEGSVAIYTQTGNGTFPTTPTDTVSYLNDYGPTSLLVGDLDGDCWVDLVTSHPKDTSSIWNPQIANHITTVYRNLDGTYGARTTYNRSGSGFMASALHDVDGDGALDVIGDGANTSVLLRQLHPGQFAEGDGLPRSSHAIKTPWPDVDADGSPDTLSGDQVLWRNGQGSFSPTTLALPAGQVGDFDGDGLYDSVGGFSFLPEEVRIWRQHSMELFTPLPNYVDLLLGGGDDAFPFYEIGVGDLSGDGIVDPVVHRVYDTGNLVFGLPFHSPQPPGLFASVFGLFGYGTMRLVDFDRDGRLDVVHAYTGLGSTSAFQLSRRDGAGYSPGETVNLFALGPPAFPGTFHDGDVNADGRVDLAMGQGDGRVFLWLQTSSGTLAATPQTFNPGGSGSSRPWMLDLDLDGNTDFLLARTDRVSVYYGTGTGLAASPQDYNLPGALRVVADFDGDQLPDLLLGATQGEVWRQVAPRVFVHGSTVPGTLPSEAVDFDHDGELDLLQGSTVRFGSR